MYILRNFFSYSNGEQIARYAYTEKCLCAIAAYNNSELSATYVHNEKISSRCCCTQQQRVVTVYVICIEKILLAVAVCSRNPFEIIHFCAIDAHCKSLKTCFKKKNLF